MDAETRTGDVVGGVGVGDGGGDDGDIRFATSQKMDFYETTIWSRWICKLLANSSK